MAELISIKNKRPRNAGKLTSQKPALKLEEIWAMRVRDLALIGFG